MALPPESMAICGAPVSPVLSVSIAVAVPHPVPLT
jgi:hypothetical protein